MSLLPYELDIIKQQLGVTLTRVGAEPYIQFVSLFDLVIQPYLFDNSTTSSTSVATVGSQTITLASNPTAPNNPTQVVFAVGTQIVVDVGALQEITTISVLSGLSATITFANTHTGPYPIWPNGAEWAVRNILARIAVIESQMGNFAPQAAGVQQVDEIKLYASTKTGGRGAPTLDMFDALVKQRMQARDDLSGAIGFPNLWRDKPGQSAPGRVEIY